MRFGSTPIIYSLTILAMLSGCASTPQQLTEAQTNQIRNVAVVSLVPESVNFDKIGVTSFTSQHTEFDLGSRVSDSILFVSHGRIMKSHPEWTLKLVEYDRAALLAAISPVSGLHAKRTKELFAGLARANDLDAIFVVRAAADAETDPTTSPSINTLREGLTVWFKNNEIDGDPKLFIRANLDISIIANNGELLAVSTIPARLDRGQELKLADYDVTADMKQNRHPEVLDKLGREVLLDLSKRLNLSFDALSFNGGANPGTQHVNVVPPIPATLEPKENPAPSVSPGKDSFDQCFLRCRQYTDRSKEQCFDVCNRPAPPASVR